MISKLPRWVWIGGAFLTFIAGTINVVGFLSFQHQGVTHLTGTTTLLGSAVASHEYGKAIHSFMIILAFVLGAIFSGFLIKDSTLRLGRRYGVALIVESLLLCIAVPLLKRNLEIGAYLTSAACGLQNAMASTYSGAVLRTTHVSGLFTDLGILAGQFFRGIAIDRKRFLLCIILSSAFFLGSVVGTIIFNFCGYNTLYIPATIIGLSGLCYGFYHHFFLHHLNK